MARSIYPIPARKLESLSEDIESAEEGSIYLTKLCSYSAWTYEKGSSVAAAYYDYYSGHFDQGADLMPRTTVMVEVVGDANPRSRTLSIHTSEFEIGNGQNKVLKGERFRGLAERKYLFQTVTSNFLLPFLILDEDLPTVVLPVHKTPRGFEVLTDDNLVDRGDTHVADWFDKVDTRLGSPPIRLRIDKRGKLAKQQYNHLTYLVHLGAGGSYPCAAAYQHPATAFPYVADQTTYVYGTDSESEAYFLVGVFNSTPVAEEIATFQSRGDFGKRHVHTLPLCLIPPFDEESEVHLKVAELAQQIEADVRANLDDKMKDLNTSLSSRRNRVRSLLDRSALFLSLDQLVTDLLARQDNELPPTTE